MISAPRLWRFIFFALAALLVACGPPWTIIRQATPNPLHGARRFALVGVSFDDVMVNEHSEAEFQARRSERARAAFEDYKQRLITQFTDRALTNRPGYLVVPYDPNAPRPDAFLLRAHVEVLELRNIEIMPSHGSRLPYNAQMNVQVLTPAGELVDEVVIDARASNPNGGERRKMEEWGRTFALHMLDYLDGRVAQP